MFEGKYSSKLDSHILDDPKETSTKSSTKEKSKSTTAAKAKQAINQLKTTLSLKN